MLKEFKSVLLLGGLVLGAVASVPVASWAQKTGVNVVFLEREIVENMLWEESQGQMGKLNVQGMFSGLGAATDSLVAVRIDKKYDMFEAWIGYLKAAPPGRSCQFELDADGVTLYESEIIKSGDEPERIRVPVKGHIYLTMRIRPQGYGMTNGACYGTPMLYSGVSPEEMAPMLSVDYNGEKIKLEQPGGRPPSEIKVPVPLKTGEYRIKVIYDKDSNHAVVTSEPVKP